MKPIKFLDAPEPCRVCKLPTVTVKVGGKIPLHIGCDTRVVLAEVEPEQLVEALTVVANVLGPISAEPPPPPWRPHEVGPCQRCRRPTRRYGPWATPLCPRCREDAQMTDQPEQLAFPILACECNHVALGGEPGDPCEVCLEQGHDCPLIEDEGDST